MLLASEGLAVGFPWEVLFNYGVLGVLVVMGCMAIWRIVHFLADKLFDNHEGVVVLYLRSHQEFLSGLAQRDERQMELCSQHAQNLKQLSSTLEQGSRITQELVALHKAPDSLFSNTQTNRNIQQLKQAGVESCRLCRELLPHLDNGREAAENRLTKIEQLLEAD
jgi:intracellular sulfur oxidation DsrE/DsrF family protein